MSSPRPERRKDPRAHAKLEVRLGRSKDGAEPLSVSTINIGAGGVYVEVPRFIAPLTKLALEMMIPGPTPEEESFFLDTDAIVVRTIPETPRDDVEQYEIACAFMNLSDEHRDAINRYILTHRIKAPA
jgi:c-di-GMP-binding flagellar brake protein YcgR